MNFFKGKWNYFVDYVRSNKTTIIINYVIFAAISFCLLLIDLLCKKYLFDPSEQAQGVIKSQNWLFGIRSVKNAGLTFLPNSGNDPIIIISNLFIWIACLISLLFLRTYWFSISIAFIFSGSLGNQIDRFAFNYVRDIIFLPWADKGTFNFADVDVIFGCCALVITGITQVIITKK